MFPIYWCSLEESTWTPMPPGGSGNTTGRIQAGEGKEGQGLRSGGAVAEAGGGEVVERRNPAGVQGQWERVMTAGAIGQPEL